MMSYDVLYLENTVHCDFFWTWDSCGLKDLGRSFASYFSFKFLVPFYHNKI
jgi:hypothetical protein